MIEKVNPMHAEVWKDVEGFEGHYQVSNHGRVRSIKKEILVLKGEYQHNGYKRVNHIDEDKKNNHVTNLQWYPPL